MAKTRTPDKPKPLTYEHIEPESEIGTRLYKMLDDLLIAHHEELLNARIALLWRTNWKPDADGRLTLGQCVKASDLHRELAPYDFAILLSRPFFEDPLVSDTQRLALIDHELTHAAPMVDESGEPVYDARGRQMWRLRKHDLEEFSCIAERYGIWKRDVEVFAAALDRARHRDPKFWIGANAVREALRAAGLSVPLDTVARWTKDEQSEAHEWARLRVELATLPGVTVQDPPAHVVAASVAEERVL